MSYKEEISGEPWKTEMNPKRNKRIFDTMHQTEDRNYGGLQIRLGCLSNELYNRSLSKFSVHYSRSIYDFYSLLSQENFKSGSSFPIP